MTGRVLLPDLICSCFLPLSPLRLPSVSLARPHLTAASPNSVPTSPMWLVTLILDRAQMEYFHHHRQFYWTGLP